MALVCGGTLNSSAANFRTAVNGAPSGTLKLIGEKKQPRDQSQVNQTRKSKTRKESGFAYTLKGSLGSEVRVTLKETFPPPVAIFPDDGGDQISTAELAFQ